MPRLSCRAVPAWRAGRAGGRRGAGMPGFRMADVPGISPARAGAAAPGLASHEEDHSQPPRYHDEDDHGQDDNGRE